MPCGKKPVVKTWDKSRKIQVITPSRYEQNEASVKVHWKKITRDLELSYKDDQFWETQSKTVRQLVGPVIFERIGKIFTLPPEVKQQYEPQSQSNTSLVPSEVFYQSNITHEPLARETFSISDYDVGEEVVQEEQSELWSVESSIAVSLERKKSSRSKARLKSSSLSKSFVRAPSKSFSKFISRTEMKQYSSRAKSIRSIEETIEETASSDDDIKVQASSRMKIRRSPYKRFTKNPHFEMLYCNESETDMIKWNSKYKHKVFEVSASDEFSKKAEIMTKMIAKEFFDWWVSLGNVEFKSEIKRPEDIEDLFQVWFDEHASRGLVLHPKILPCVLQTIANYVEVPRAACPNVLKQQIAYDIYAETSPAHTMAFGTCLPLRMKHIPPKNNTRSQWHCVKIPEDLRTMACVWEDVQHLTSTKAFQKWLLQRPHLPMPTCLKVDPTAGDKKQLFVVPSDYVIKDRSTSTSTQDLALPVSQFSLELKEVLSKLMNK